MSQSLSKMFVHIVFSTKHREPVLHKKIQPELWRYMGGICNNLECIPILIGGYLDHTHILCILSKKMALMQLIKEIKTGSSIWIKTKGLDFSNFHWQDGYGGFSVGQVELEELKKYVESQQEHHHIKSFQEEYREFLKKYHVEYDERYVWD